MTARNSIPPDGDALLVIALVIICILLFTVGIGVHH
jgi:hypothetical protein